MSNRFLFTFLIVMMLYISLSTLIQYQITKYQFNNAQVYQTCGVFSHYEEVNESSSGRIELITTYLNIKDNTGNIFRFMYHGRLHKNVLDFKKLKPNERVCFEYIKPYFKKYGEKLIKSIELK